MSAITLPGDIPGLLRRGSPVVATIGNLPGQRGIYVMCDPERADRACVVVEDLPGYGQIIAWPLVSATALDLTNATGRAHAAWWWNSSRQRSTTTSEPFFGAMLSPAVRYLSGGRHLHAASRPAGRPGYLATADVVPALAMLDPDDGTRLPDGSRWVDAEALRLVCLHVAGRAP